MKTYSIAAKKPGNVIVKAKSAVEAIQKAVNGEGEWEDDIGASIEIVGNSKRGVVAL